MEKANKKDDKSTWAIGGGILIGIGFGFFFLQESALAFVGSILIGLGLGLMVTSIISRDYPVIVALTLVFAVIVIVVNLLVDLSYALLDPRIRL